MTAFAFIQYLGPLLRGAKVTVEVFLGAAAISLVMALIVGLGRLSPRKPVRWLSTVYIEFFRGTSVLVQLFWIYFALPAFGVSFSALAAGILALGLNVGAYGGELVRGAVQAVPRGQVEAAIALNMSPTLRMRRVILPQAVVAILPPMGNLMIELLKGTSLVSLVTLSDLTFQAQILRSRTGDTVTIFVLVLIIYFLMSSVITACVRVLERRVSRGLDVGRQRRSEPSTAGAIARLIDRRQPGGSA
ncbi:MAG TPA: ectoine/hydroxyectoine ABC transporter permease subunit EhuC [Solirubrobacteraceae bacterium]|nr:ectoine/hydroxyectoine ABC transporter permease subunit EhuC [Solirubrobacteraceae bacterium]